MDSLSSQPSAQGLSHTLVDWHRSSRIAHPWRVAFRQSGDPYVIWVAEVMLQQTTIAAVSPKYRTFIQTLPNLEALAAAPESRVLSLTAGLGYYQRFRWMHEVARQLIKTQQYSLPTNYGSLLKLKGIGTYTAAAIASICFNESVPCIDGNVKRVISRIFDLRLPPHHQFFTQELFDELKPIIHRQAPGMFNEALMELGQRICTSQSPRCTQCPITTKCLAFQRNSIPWCPTKVTSSPKIPLNLTVKLICHPPKILLSTRSHNFPVLKNSVGFPLQITTHNHSKPNLVASHQNFIGEFKHAITKFRINVLVYHQTIATIPIDGHQHNHSHQWCDYDQVESQLISSLDRKAWQLFKRYHLTSHPTQP